MGHHQYRYRDIHLQTPKIILDHATTKNLDSEFIQETKDAQAAPEPKEAKDIHQDTQLPNDTAAAPTTQD